MKMKDYDYDYYAKDVKLEDITSSQDNAELLAWVRDNDPDFHEITINTAITDENDFVVREGDHLGWLGYFVGRNDKLTTLFICNFPDNININAFLEGLGHNRSITELSIFIDLGDSFQSLIPFLRNNESLSKLGFFALDIGLPCARNIAMLLGQQSSLKCLTFDEGSIVLGDEGLKQIAIGLRSQPQIEELFLTSNSVGRNG